MAPGAFDSAPEDVRSGSGLRTRRTVEPCPWPVPRPVGPARV